MILPCQLPCVRTGLPLLVLLLVAAPALHAQRPRPVGLLLGGGVALPNGSYDYHRDVGYQVQGALEFAAEGSGTLLRIEGLYNRFGFTYMDPGMDCIGGPCPRQRARASTLAGTFNLVFGLRPLHSLTPYVVAGAGVYRHDNTANGAGTGTEPPLGVNGGIGVRIPALHMFVEAREHFVKNAANALPVTAGLRF